MRTRQTFMWTILCSCLSVWAASQTWGFEDGADPIGLDGLLPAYAPDGLTEDDFEKLEKNIDASWKDWTRETATFVKNFYEGDHPTIPEQEIALKRVQVKLGTLEKALADSRYRSIFPQLQSLYEKLSPEVHLAEAMLSTLTMDPQAARAQRLQPAFEKLAQATDNLSADLKSYRNGGDWEKWIRLDELESIQPDDPKALQLVKQLEAKLDNRESYTPEVRDFVSREPFLELEDALRSIRATASQKKLANQAQLRALYIELQEAIGDYQHEPSSPNEAKIRTVLDEVRRQSPDGGVEVASAVGKGFLNYNLRIEVAEGFVNRFIQKHRRESSQIRDHIMQAAVYGYQCSDITTRIDLVPSEVNARFRLNLSGSIFSNTNGVTSQATVHTIGNHSFTASKPVMFDGQNFYLEDGYVSARANNQFVGARTKFSHVPLLGRLADRIAIREANSMRPQSNALAVQKITRQVTEQLETEAGTQFANASKQLQSELYGPLRKYNLYPDTMMLSTSDTELRLWSRLMDSDEIAGSAAIPVAGLPSNGMVAQIHESLLSHVFDRLGLNGKTMTEDEVRELLESRLSEITGRDVSIPKPEGAADASEQAANVLKFDENDPVRFTIAEGVVTLIIRAGLKRDNGDDIPTQIISVPFEPIMQGDKILLKRGNVGVKPVTRPPGVAAQITRAKVMTQKIQSALPEQTLESKFAVTTQAGDQVNLRVSDLIAEGGWLVLTVR